MCTLGMEHTRKPPSPFILSAISQQFYLSMSLNLIDCLILRPHGIEGQMTRYVGPSLLHFPSLTGLVGQIRSITPTKSPHFQPPNLPPNSPRAIMAIYILNTCATIQDIIDAMNPPLPPAVNPREPQYFKYNFIPLLDSVRTPKHAKDEFQGGRLPKRKHPTVEFRQQPGTLDPDTMVHYIRLLGAIVHLAGSIGLESLKEFLGVEDWRWINHSGYRSNSESSSSSADSQHESTHPNISQPSLSAFSLLSNLQPVGSFARLLTAMEVAHIPLDENTMRFWCRKVRTGSPRAII